MRGGRLKVEVEARWRTLGLPLNGLLEASRGSTWLVVILVATSYDGVLDYSSLDVISLVKP